MCACTDGEVAATVKVLELDAAILKEPNEPKITYGMFKKLLKDADGQPITVTAALLTAQQAERLMAQGKTCVLADFFP